SLFGAGTGVTESITLPDVSNVDRREMLNWERELIGLYISDHPLTPYQQTFTQIVSYFSGQLHEAQHEEKVRVAGLITAVRPYTTKTNKPMGFVTIEDIQGNIELVLFPRTWAQYREHMTVGQIIIVEGKADTNSTPPKILVDTIRTEIKILEPLEPSASLSAGASTLSKPVQDPAPVKPSQPESAATDVKDKSTLPRSGTALQKKIPVNPSIPPPIRQIGEKAVPSYAATSPLEETWNDAATPPPPDNFPDDWATQWQPSFEEASIAARPEPKADTTSVNTPRLQTEVIEAQSEIDEREKAEAAREAAAIQTMKVETPQLLTSLYVPLAKEEKDKDHSPQQVTVILRSTGEKDHDRRRIKTIYGTLISFHGRDRFSFQIYENGLGYLIDFPNDTTRVCNEMLERLKKLMGEESWRVEEITFQ
ncbi:MAG TPA: OB-fold nucleic acid binding domain-containing protein, partial [Anaerolineales bacterium]|nr:OB-fold nucleic acid binding domain-containing protein [Anaerolineales bacterium]